MGKTCTMDGRKHLKPFCPNWKSCHFMDSKHGKFVPIVKWKQSWWLWHKVWIERFDYIPNTIELVGKSPKMNDKWEVCVQCSVEVLAYSCEHSGVIKFLVIDIKTLEAYTLWWNEGTHNWKMLDYNMKYSPIMDNWT
jgi:hypothetical protein